MCMREEIEEILNRYAFEFNTPEVRKEILHVLTYYLRDRMSRNQLYDFKIEDRTELNENNDFYFQIFYQLRRATEIMVIDIALPAGFTISNFSFTDSPLLISDFEKNLIGKRDIKKLNFGND